MREHVNAGANLQQVIDDVSQQILNLLTVIRFPERLVYDLRNVTRVTVYLPRTLI